MATKTISIMTDVHRLLVARKRKGESFSDVIRKTLRQKTSIMDFAGVWSDLTDDARADIKKEIKKLRTQATKELLQNT